MHQIGKQISDYRNDRTPSVKDAIYRGFKWIIYSSMAGGVIGYSLQ